MPIYSYQCKKCQHAFEHLVGVTAKGEDICCPQCGHTDLEKKISGFSVGSAPVKSSAGGSCSSGGCCPTC